MRATIAAVTLAGTLALPFAAATTAPAKKRALAQKKSPPAAATEPAPEQRPLLPHELPPAPPQVIYRGGLLFIRAENSTLSDVLQAVGRATGARVEGPMSAERVSVRLGPGAPRQVLADLLTGSNFNYVIVGSPENVQAVTAVTLTVRSGPPTPPSATPQYRHPNITQVEPQDLDQEPQIEPIVEQPEPEPEPPATQPGATGQPENTPQQPKSPQQLLQELQERLQKQREEQENKPENQRTEEPPQQ
ncbi:MAG TPA: hypothetical protein VNK82_02940 [Terriglobales bacterium]|nr:hypothetical protein [Terriglobales bacterium]